MQPPTESSQEHSSVPAHMTPDSMLAEESTEFVPDPDKPINLEEEWPTHGGYLGCLMGIMFGCLAAAFIASPLVRGATHVVANIGFQLNASALVIMLIGIMLFGFIGWKIGKRIFRDFSETESKIPSS